MTTGVLAEVQLEIKSKEQNSPQITQIYTEKINKSKGQIPETNDPIKHLTFNNQHIQISKNQFINLSI
jgi:hypothetical protein